MGSRNLITANAGTGKTYNLTAHLANLLERHGVKPEAIVALTFSRAAAGEIFQELVRRLFDSGNGMSALRSLVASQHLCCIGTIDSFLMKMIRMFPLELGLSGTIAVLNEYERRMALQECLQRTLSSNAAGVEEMASTVLGMFAQSGKKSLCATLDGFVEQLLDSYAELSGRRWGGRSDEMLAVFASRAARHRELSEVVERVGKQFAVDERLEAGFSEIRKFVADFAGRFGSGTATPVKNLLGAIDFSTWSIAKFNMNRKTVQLDPESSNALLEVFKELLEETLMVVSMKTDALGRFLERVYGEYRSRWLDRGQITFGDMARLISRLPEDVRMAIEYRFDSKFEHWALDEFQDTSYAQWNAIGGLISESLQSEDRSVFMVGDPKQAIYGWRGGAVEIFTDAAASGLYEERFLTESFRYAAPISEMLNRIFGNPKLKEIVAAKSPEAAENWSRLWKEHTSNAQKTGRGCFILKELADAGSQRGANLDGYVQIIKDELERIEYGRRKIRCAVLVRSGSDGAAIAEKLRALGYRAVFEGNTGIFDIPAVSYLAELAAWAEHPASDHARRLFAISPLKDVALAEPDAFLRSVTRIGLARTFRELIDSLPPEAVADALVWQRLEETVRAAVKFEAAGAGSMRLDAFSAFLERESVRNDADDEAIAVMTIHHSKGLTKDVTFFPVIESFGMDSSRSMLLTADDWVLEQPDGVIVDSKLDPAVSAAEATAAASRIYEEICVNYVAMTRAKKELFVILPTPPKKATSTLKFSRIVREILGDDMFCGDEWWFETMESRPENFEYCGFNPRESGLSREYFRQQRIARVVPSSDRDVQILAKDIFGGRGGDAARRGTEYHARMEAVEFDDEAFEGALRRPDGFVELWREKAYEIYDEARSVWESGMIDRVVFSDDDGGLKACIYDFKTNEPGPGEDEAQFADRLKRIYSSQMASYRNAVSRLTGIDAANIRSCLLAEKIGKAIEV